MDNHQCALLAPQRQRFAHAGYLLGFASGGFFDGILLHQILQWHHLLSALERASVRDLRVQILADGLFHAVMYLVAVAGSVQLVRARYLLLEKTAPRLLLAHLAIGFGGWHVLDALLSHWLLGIHHIRMDVPNPWPWDIGWFVLFGVLFIAVGLFMRHRKPPSLGDETPARTRSTLVPLLLVSIAGAALLSVWAPFTPQTPGTTMVLLRPDSSPAKLLAGMHDSNVRVIWHSTQGEVWIFAVGQNTHPWRFYRHGALFVSGTWLPAGCSSWTRI